MAEEAEEVKKSYKEWNRVTRMYKMSPEEVIKQLIAVISEDATLQLSEGRSIVELLQEISPVVEILQETKKSLEAVRRHAG